MQRIGKSKVTKLKAKAGVVYPLIRLPKTFADEIGKVAEIFETQCDGRRALLVTFENRAEPSEVVQPDSKVIQLLPKVIQLQSRKSIESRFLELESEIKQLRETLFSNETEDYTKNENKWARSDSNA
jgi:hypothetical protein